MALALSPAPALQHWVSPQRPQWTHVTASSSFWVGRRRMGQPMGPLPTKSSRSWMNCACTMGGRSGRRPRGGCAEHHWLFIHAYLDSLFLTPSLPYPPHPPHTLSPLFSPPPSHPLCHITLIPTPSPPHSSLVLPPSFSHLTPYRWLKFEEDVEEGGDKWSKPHVATLSLHSLFELRSNLMRGTVMLDVEANNLAHIAGETGQQTSTPIMFACG